ncbi:MAG: multidrug effflux MFS transporter [Peptococcaceae bacterium]|jgi:DHA1 family bicyclomycin/chloramphenicol resistance-like MFS transporter|nr:multidrug effflux MFS transporter [Peptococcaceae bacterium]
MPGNSPESVRALKVAQNILGYRGLIAFLTLLSAFPAMSTDLYLPALPAMTHYFQASEYQINLSLTLFFIFFALSSLIWGPLSDQYGRKRILLAGMALYTGGAILCVLSLSNLQLVLCRCLQAAGGGAATTIATAIVKDEFQAKRRETILAMVQSMVVLAPAVAPVIGALLLRFTSWRGIFVTQAVFGVALFAGALVFTETLEDTATNSGSVAQTMGRLVTVLRNPRFTALLIMLSLLNIGSMAFISGSSYIYQNFYGLSTQMFSFYFALNALVMMAGPLVYLRLAARFTRYRIVTSGFGVFIVSGLLVSLLHGLGPWIFALALLPASLAFIGLRPPGTYLMLNQQTADSGSAASLITSMAMISGSIGVTLISFGMDNPALAVGMIDLSLGVLCGGAWLCLTHSRFLRSIRDT